MPYGLNQYSQYSDFYNSKLNSVNNSSTMGYKPSAYTPSFSSTQSTGSKYVYQPKEYDTSSITERLSQFDRSTVDRVFDALSVFNYATMGAIHGTIDKDSNTTFVSGLLGGLKAANPLSYGYQKGEITASDVLTDLGWKGKGAISGITKFGTGLALDILTDPTTYMTFGLAPLFKGMGKVATHADDAVKFSNNLSDITKVKGAEQATEEMVSNANRLKRKTTPDDVREFLKGSGWEDKYVLDDEIITDFTNRVNKYSGLDYEKTPLAFDFFSNKKWGFRKEFVSGERIAEWSDKVGFAPMTQELVDNIVMSPTWGKMGKKQLRQQMARTDINKLMTDIVVEDITKGRLKAIRNKNADIHEFYSINKDVIPEDRMKEISKYLENGDEYFKSREYADVASTPIGKELVEDLKALTDDMNSEIGKVTQQYYDFISKKSEASSKLSRKEKMLKKHLDNRNKAKKDVDTLSAIKGYADNIEPIKAEFDNVSSKIALEEEAIKSVKKKNIDGLATEIESRVSMSDDEMLIDFLQKGGDLEELKYIDEFLRVNKLEGVSTKIISEIKDDMKKAEFITKIDEYSSIVSDALESSVTKANDIDKERVARYAKASKKTATVELNDMTGAYEPTSIERVMLSGIGFSNKAIDGTPTSVKSLKVKFELEGKEVPFEKYESSTNLLQLLKPNRYKVMKKEMLDLVESTPDGKLIKTMQEYLDKHLPTLGEYFSKLHFARSFSVKDGDKWKTASKTDMFNQMVEELTTKPVRYLHHTMLKYTAGYDTALRVLEFDGIKTVKYEEFADMTKEQAVQMYESMYGVLRGADKKSKEKVLNTIIARYNTKLYNMLNDPDYMREQMLKMRKMTREEKVKKEKFDTTKIAINQMKKKIDDDFLMEKFSNPSVDTTMKVLDGFMYAPKEAIEHIVKGTKKDKLYLLKTRHETYRREIDKTIRLIKTLSANPENAVKVKALEGQLDTLRNKLTTNKDEIKKGLFSGYTDFKQLKYFYLQEEAIKMYKNKMQVEKLTTPNTWTDNDVEKIIGQVESKVRQYGKSEIGKISTGGGIDDAYYDSRNTIDFDLTKTDKTVVDRSKTDVSNIDDLIWLTDNISDGVFEAERKLSVIKHEATIKEFTNETINAIQSAYTQAMRDSLNNPTKDYSLFSVIKDTLKVDNDVAYDMFNKMMDIDDIRHFVDDEGIFKYRLTEEDAVFAMLKTYMPEVNLGQLSDKTIVEFEKMLSQLSASGNIQRRTYAKELDRFTQLVNYVEEVKYMYSKNGGDVKMIESLDLNISKYDEYISDINTGGFVWKDLYNINNSITKNMKIELKDIEMDDIKLAKHNIDSLKELQTESFNRMTSKAKEFNKSAIDQLKREVDEWEGIDNIPEHLKASRKAVVDQAMSMSVALQKVMGIEGVQHTEDLAKDFMNMRWLLDDARVKEMSGLSSYAHVANGILTDKRVIDKADVTLSKAEKTLDNTKTSILQLKKDIRDMEESLFKTVKGTGITFDGMESMFINGNDEALTIMNNRYQELKGLLDTILSAKTADDVNWELIKEALPKGRTFTEFDLDSVVDGIRTTLQREVVDKSRVRLDSKLNEMEQAFLIKNARLYDEMLDMEGTKNFVQYYLPHMIKPQYQHLFSQIKEFNPIANLIGGGIESFNKHSLGRKWQMTIEQYKVLVKDINNGININDTDNAWAFYDATFRAFSEEIVRKGTHTISIPGRSVKSLDLDDKPIMTSLSFSTKLDSETGELRLSKLKFQVPPDRLGAPDTYMIDEYKKEAEEYLASLSSSSYNKGGEIGLAHKNNADKLELAKYVLNNKVGIRDLRGKFKVDFENDAIPSGVLRVLYKDGTDLFKQMPEDLFEDNAATLLLKRALYSNKIVADEEFSEKLINMTSRKPKFEEGELIQGKEYYTIPTRYYKQLLDEIGTEEKFRSIDEQAISFNRDKMKSNTFIRLSKAQVIHIVEKNYKPVLEKIRITDEHFLKQLNEAQDKQLNKSYEAFLKGYDYITRLWKLNVTVVSPAFHITNKIGSTFNSFMDVGMDVLNPELRKSAKDIIKNKNGFFTLNDGTQMSYASLLSHATDLGVIDGGAFGQDVRELLSKQKMITEDNIIDWVHKKTKINKEKLVESQKWNPLSPDTFIPYKKGTEIGSHMENIDKLVNFLSHIKNGKTFGDAAEHTSKFLFDYSDMTEFEKDYVKRIYPFWTFMRKNTSLQFEMLMKKPHIYRTIAKIRNEFEAQTPMEERVDKRKIAGYARDWWQTPFDRQTRTSTTDLLLNPNLPFQSLNTVSPDTLKGSISPILKALYELPTGKSLYSGKDIYSGPLGYMSTQTYLGGTINKLDSSGVDGKIIKLASALLGIKIGQYTEEKENLLYHDEMLNKSLKHIKED